MLTPREPDIYWTGASGTQYGYFIYPLNGLALSGLAGNYIFAKQTSPGIWAAIYIGQTHNLAQRIASHEKLECAILNGATHLHAKLTEGGEEVRCHQESDLVARYRPPCNG